MAAGIIAGNISVTIVQCWYLDRPAAQLLVSVEDSIVLGLALGAAVLRFLHGGPFGGIPVNKYELGHHSISIYTKVHIMLKAISRLHM